MSSGSRGPAPLPPLYQSRVYLLILPSPETSSPKRKIYAEGVPCCLQREIRWGWVPEGTHVDLGTVNAEVLLAGSVGALAVFVLGIIREWWRNECERRGLLVLLLAEMEHNAEVKGKFPDALGRART